MKTEELTCKPWEKPQNHGNNIKTVTNMETVGQTLELEMWDNMKTVGLTLEMWDKHKTNMETVGQTLDMWGNMKTVGLSQKLWN